MERTGIWNAGTLVGALIAAAGLGVILLLRPPTVAGSNAVLSPLGQPAGISVSGEGKMTLVPDQATVRLGVDAQAPTVEAARLRAAEAMAQVVSALRAGGIAENDIKTANFNISQDRRPGPNGTMINEGYRVQNMVTAKIKSVGDTGRIVDAASAAGGNLARVDQVSFGLNDPSKFQSQLRELAMADAKARGEQLARLSGKGLGDPIHIQEGSAPIEVNRQVMQRASAPAAQDTFLAPGETEVRLNVQVVYAIR